MNSDVNIAADLSILMQTSTVNKSSLVNGWVFYQYLLGDLCWHAGYQHCGKILSTWVKLPL